jgi:hypothetical protein
MRYLSLEQATEGWALDTGGRVSSDGAICWRTKDEVPKCAPAILDAGHPVTHLPSSTPADRSLAI